MKRFTKIIATVVSLLLLVTSMGFAGTKAMNEAPTELTVTFLVTGAVPADTAIVQDAINKLTIPKINAKVTLMPVNFGAAMQQYNLMLSSGEKLDLMLTFPMTYASLVAQGKIKELGPLVDKYGAGIKKAMGGYYKQTFINGKTYGVRPLADMAGGGGLCIRADIAKKYKIDMTKVKSFKDVGKVLKTIKDHEPNSYPLTYFNTQLGIEGFLSLFDTDNLSDGFGVLTNYGSSLKVQNLFTSKAYIDNIKTLREWYLKGYIMRDVATSKEDSRALVAAGKSYCYFVPTKPGIEQQESGQVGTQCTIKQISTPFAQSGSPTFAWVVPNACERPDKAVQLLNLMYSDSALENLLSWGIEGKHYQKKKDGTIGFPAGVDEKNSGYFMQQPWMMGNEFLAHIWTGDSPNLWKDIQNFNKSAKLSKAMGFIYDPTPVKTEVAAVTNVYNQYRRGIESGAVSVDQVYPQFIRKMRTAGLDKIIAEKQRQLDAWAKTQKIK